MTSPVNYVDPTGHMAMHNPSGESSVVVVPEPEPESRSSDNSYIEIDSIIIKSNDVGSIEPSLAYLYYKTLEMHNELEHFHYEMNPYEPFTNTGVCFTDYSYNAGAWLGMTGGYGYIVNLNEGWVSEYEHVGPYLSVGVAPASVQITTGRVMGDDITSPLFYEGFFREFSASAVGSYTNALSVFNDSGPLPVIQEGGGMETNVGITANLSYYWLTNIVYIRGGDNE